MSDSEKKKRNGYIKNRDRWIFAHTVIIVVVAIAVLISAIVAAQLNKTYYIGYTETGHIDYNVFLKDNEFYDTPYLGKDQAYVASLIDQIIADFNYRIAMDTDDVHYRYSYSIKSRLEILDTTSGVPLFNPEYELVNHENLYQSSASTLVINEMVPLDYDWYNELAAKFLETYDLSATSSSIVVTMEVSVMSDCNAFTGSATDTFTSELRIPLTTKTVNIEMTSTVPEPEAQMIACVRGVASQVFKTTAIVLAVIDGLLILVLLAFIHLTKTPDVTYAGRVKRTLAQYKSYIQKIHAPFDDTGYQVLELDTFEEMLEIRDTIQAPILMHENEDKTCAKFWIPTDSKLLYLYAIKVDGYREEPKPKKPAEPTTVVKPQITNVVKPVVKVVMTPPEPTPPPPPPPEPDPEPVTVVEPEMKSVVEEAEIEVVGEEESPIIILVETEEDESEEESDKVAAELVAAVVAAEGDEDAIIEIIEEPVVENAAEVIEDAPEEPAVEPSVEAILETIPEVVEPKSVVERPKHIVVLPSWDEAVQDNDNEIDEAEVATGEYRVELNPSITKTFYTVKRRAIKVFTALITPDDEEPDQDL